MLPNLPKQHKSKEADFGLIFRKWWVAHPMRGEFELKHTRGKSSLAFSEVHEEQIAIGLQAISKKGVLLRRESGTIGAADYSGVVESPYWIVIKYSKHFYIISLETFILERNRSKKKSLSEDRAEAIAIITV